MDNGNWILKTKNLVKIYGEASSRSIGNTGSIFNSNICPETKAVVSCAEVDFCLYPGEVLGIVGESGSGKSTIIKLLNFDLEATDGELYLKNYKNGEVNVLKETSLNKRYIKNYLMGTVYQNPRDGLNFNFSSGGNIAEKLLLSGEFNVQKIRARASELLEKTEIPVERMDILPSMFSGGMQQRVQISKAIANNPPILFLDEVTTGLDVSVQAKVLDLIQHLQHELKISMIVVSHDLGVIKMLTDRTMVMKNGRMVEFGLTDQILQDPQHVYTQTLVNSLLI